MSGNVGRFLGFVVLLLMISATTYAASNRGGAGIEQVFNHTLGCRAHDYLIVSM